MKKAIVIFSGGQDSATCLFWALNNFDVVETITFLYGQKHAIELECAQIICAANNVKQTVIDLGFLNTIVDSAMVSNGNTSVLNAKGLPASFVPNRNQLFITLAHAYAQKVNAHALVTGVCQTDYSGYPDCRDKFIKELEYVTNLGSESEIKIYTPLMWLTKAQTFELAAKMGRLPEIIERTHTCYEGDHTTKNDWGYGCGVCPACILRKQGYSEFTTSLQK